MNHIFSVVCVLVTLLQTSNGLSCVQCTSTKGFECTGVQTNCTANNTVCASRFTQTTGMAISVERICASPTYCNQSFTYNMIGIKTTITSSCCFTDGCTPTSPSIIVNGSGIKCPSCYEQGSSQCNQVNDIECVGTENKCFSYTFSSDTNKVFVRGCTTEQLCSNTIGTIVPTDVQGGKIQCAKGCTDNCLRCVHCQGKGFDCSGSLSSCTETNAVCSSRFTQNSVGDQAVERGCAVPTYCEQSYTLIESNIKAKISSSCCTTDGCTPKPPSTGNLDGNGVQCPSCTVTGSSKCSQFINIECTGKEDRCFTYSLSSGSNQLFASGCTTQSICTSDGNDIIPVEWQGGSKQCTATNKICTGNCLRCVICESSVGFECEASLGTCPGSNAVCASVFSQSTDGSKTVKRVCAQQTFCDQSFTLTTEPGKTRTFSSCCNTEGCKPISPSSGLDGNGVQCPSCSVTGSNQCSRITNIECSGNEDRCFTYSLSSGSNQLFASGCTTQSICTSDGNNIIPSEWQGGSKQCTATNKICTGNCLRCVVCQSLNGFECGASLAICSDSNSICASIFTESTDRSKSVERGCASPSFCDQSFTLTNGMVKTKISSSCCNTEGCKPSSPSNIANGLKCPSCYVQGSKECIQVNTIECTGNENKCYSYYAQKGSSANQVFARGCATDRLCSSIINTIVPINMQDGEVQCSGVKSIYTSKFGIVFLVFTLMAVLYMT